MAQPGRTNAAEAWTAFWAEQGSESRCLAKAPELFQPLDAHWRNFACTLVPETRIIDLACGGGAVGRSLIAAQPRLHVTGVDIADVPCARATNVELMSATAMEELPFGDATFGAAVSQFGFEYGDPKLAAKEVARVLQPGAPFSFLMHHADGPLVSGMRLHRQAIESLCGLRVQAAFFAGNVNELADRFASLKRDCSNDPIVDLAERGLHANIRNDQPKRLNVWRAVVEALAPELFMLDSLELCSGDEAQVRDHLEPLTEWFDVRLPGVVRTARGEPIAWKIHGTRI